VSKNQRKVLAGGLVVALAALGLVILATKRQAPRCATPDRFLESTIPINCR